MGPRRSAPRRRLLLVVAGLAAVAAPVGLSAAPAGANQPQTITCSPPPNPVTVDGTPQNNPAPYDYQDTASPIGYYPNCSGGGSGNPVTFSVDPASTYGSCVYSSGGTDMGGYYPPSIGWGWAPGTCIIDFNQAGGNGYDPAPQYQQQVQVVLNPPNPPPPPSCATDAPTHAPWVAMASFAAGQDYWLAGQDGNLADCEPQPSPNQQPASSSYHNHDQGSLRSPGAPSVDDVAGMAATPDGGGYWMVGSDGGIFAFGDAAFYGSMGGHWLAKPVVGMAATPDGKGYWLVASDGGIFAFGDAAFYGSMGGQYLARPVVGMAATPDGKGYWLVASDGGIFAFGDAAFYGSMGGQYLARPVVGMASTPDGKGYWLVASDGGIFAFGDAAFYGSMGGQTLARPVVAMAGTPDGKGYWLVASDGGIFAFGSAPFAGSPTSPPVYRTCCW